MKSPGQISASQEDYLEAIHHVIAETRVARVRDIARRLGVGYSSVTGALQTLAHKGLVNYAPYELVTLTPDGEKTAIAVIGRHETLRAFFERTLAVEPDRADDIACAVEHVVPQDVVDKIARLTDAVDLCPHCDLFHRTRES